MIYIKLSTGRVTVHRNRPSLGTWVDLSDIVKAIDNGDNASTLFCDFEDLNQAINLLEDGEALTREGITDRHSETVENLHAMLKV